MTTTVFSSSVLSDDDPVFTFVASGDRLIVNAGVTLSTQGAAGVVFAPGFFPNTGLSDLHATINGTLLSAPENFAISAFGSSIDLTVGTAGRIEAQKGTAFYASYDSSVANHGVMRGYNGVAIDSLTDSTVENWGSIMAGGVAVEFDSADSPAARCSQTTAR